MNTFFSHPYKFPLAGNSRGWWPSRPWSWILTSEQQARGRSCGFRLDRKDITFQSGIGYVYDVYLFSLFWIRSIIFQNKWENCRWARHGSGIGKQNDRPPLSTFLCLWFTSSCHSASSPFICHNRTSVKAELYRRACSCCGRLSDVSVFPLYAFYCLIFSSIP